MINVNTITRTVFEVEAKDATAYEIYKAARLDGAADAKLIDVDERDGIFILVFESETYE